MAVAPCAVNGDPLASCPLIADDTVLATVSADVYLPPEPPTQVTSVPSELASKITECEGDSNCKLVTADFTDAGITNLQKLNRTDVQYMIDTSDTYAARSTAMIDSRFSDSLINIKNAPLGFTYLNEQIFSYTNFSPVPSLSMSLNECTESCKNSSMCVGINFDTKTSLCSVYTFDIWGKTTKIEKPPNSTIIAFAYTRYNPGGTLEENLPYAQYDAYTPASGKINIIDGSYDPYNNIVITGRLGNLAEPVSTIIPTNDPYTKLYKNVDNDGVSCININACNRAVKTILYIANGERQISSTAIETAEAGVVDTSRITACTGCPRRIAIKSKDYTQNDIVQEHTWNVNYILGDTIRTINAGYFGEGFIEQLMYYNINQDFARCASYENGYCKQPLCIGGTIDNTNTCNCPNGTFLLNDECIPCTTCPSPKIVKTACTATTDTICGCPTRFTGTNCDTCDTGYTGTNCDICTVNYTWNGTKCTRCLNNGTISSGPASGSPRQCTCIRNTAGYSCEICPDNAKWDGSYMCVNCPPNSTSSRLPASGPANYCTCNTGYTGANCDTCDTNYTRVVISWNAETNIYNTGCRACLNRGTINGVSLGGSTSAQCICPPEYSGFTCDQCSTNYTWNGTSCVACPPNSEKYNQFASGGASPCTCKPEYYWNGTSSCIACPVNQTALNLIASGSASQCQCKLEYTGAMCQTCKDNYRWNGINACYLCPTGAVSSGLPASGPANQCNCPQNYKWDGVSQCIQCPAGTVGAATPGAITIGVPIPGPVASGTATQCLCDFNYTWNGTACVACQHGGTIPSGPASGSARSCISCPLQYGGIDCSSCANGYTGVNCDMCATNYTWSRTGDSNIYRCLACPTNSTIVSGPASGPLRFCTCMKNYVWNGSICAACPTNAVKASEAAYGPAKTCDCPQNYAWNGTACVACASGTYIASGPASGTATTCLSSCSTNYTWNGTSCVLRPTYTTSDGQSFVILNEYNGTVNIYVTRNNFGVITSISVSGVPYDSNATYLLLSKYPSYRWKINSYSDPWYIGNFVSGVLDNNQNSNVNQIITENGVTMNIKYLRKI